MQNVRIVLCGLTVCLFALAGCNQNGDQAKKPWEDGKKSGDQQAKATKPDLKPSEQSEEKPDASKTDSDKSAVDKPQDADQSDEKPEKPEPARVTAGKPPADEAAAPDDDGQMKKPTDDADADATGGTQPSDAPADDQPADDAPKSDDVTLPLDPPAPADKPSPTDDLEPADTPDIEATPEPDSFEKPKPGTFEEPKPDSPVEPAEKPEPADLKPHLGPLPKPDDAAEPGNAPKPADDTPAFDEPTDDQPADEQPPAAEAAEAAPADEPEATEALIRVSVPPQAKVYVDGRETSSTSSTRLFAIPGLKPGEKKMTTIKAVVQQGEFEHTREKSVELSPGATARVDLDFSDALGDDTRTARKPVKTRLTIEVPEDAQLYLGGNPTSKTGTTRTFTTTALGPGEEWSGYIVKAVIKRNGRPVTDERRITLRAGDEVQLQFDFGQATEEPQPADEKKQQPEPEDEKQPPQLGDLGEDEMSESIGQ